ncbi:MAG: NUDIX domain-containing protein [Proteobacteria bacterium]|nr:NUDIX domain-containing protein [Pseudomonadota bacterium]
MSRKPFVLSVKVIVRDDAGRCLLLKRSMSSKGNPGKWDLPGGKIERGENFDEALLREVKEETGLTITLEHLAGTAESELPTNKVIHLILEGHLKSGEVRLSSEHNDYIWIDPHKLSTVDLAEQFREFAKTLQ